MEMTNKEYRKLILEYYNGEKVNINAKEPIEVYAALTAHICKECLSKESAIEYITGKKGETK